MCPMKEEDKLSNAVHWHPQSVTATLSPQALRAFSGPGDLQPAREGGGELLIDITISPQHTQ